MRVVNKNMNKEYAGIVGLPSPDGSQNGVWYRPLLKQTIRPVGDRTQHLRGAVECRAGAALLAMANDADRDLGRAAAASASTCTQQPVQ